MKTYVPDYYESFACIKGDCRHSCCVGWEIDIDASSLERFKSVPGELGARLKENIVESEAGASFRMDEDERCPFLNREGLCDLILGLGEDCLCQICDDHPRFRNFFSDREEIGLGLCCEAAGQLILGRKDKAQLQLVEDDGCEEELYEEDQELLSLRDQLIHMAQDRSMSVEARIRSMLDYLEMDLKPIDWAQWSAFLLELERLDDQWVQCLLELNGTQHNLDEWDLPFEQLLVYLLFRHLPGVIEDDDLAGRIAYVFFAWHLVRRLCAVQAGLDFDALVETCRLYSSELEYSDENIVAIINRIHELNPEL